MTINDNCDIVHAIGFVAIYGAYVEDRIAELVLMCINKIPLKKNILKLSATDQAKYLMRALKEEYQSVTPYHSKESDFKQMFYVLKFVKIFLRDRHHMIHSTLNSQNNGQVILQINRRNNTQQQVTSKEVIDLANNLYDFQSHVDSLKLPLQRFFQKKFIDN